MHPDGHLTFAVCSREVVRLFTVHRPRRDVSGGGLPPPDAASHSHGPPRFYRLSSETGLGHSIVIVSTVQRQQAAGAAQVGPQAAGAAQVGAQAAGAAQVGAQPELQQLLRTLQQRILGQCSLGILKQQDFLQQLLQPLLQQVGAGAQQVGAAAGAQATGAAHEGAQAGAHAAGAAQLGAHAAGAAHVGAGAAQDAGAQPHPELRWWWNRPASALLMLVKQTSAAVIHANFI